MGYYSQDMTIQGVVAKTTGLPKASGVNNTMNIDGEEIELGEYQYEKLTGNDVSKLKIPIEYQRIFSPAAIRSYGQLKPTCLTGAILAERPNGDRYVVDGIHKAVIYENTNFNVAHGPVLFHCLVYKHPLHLTDQICMKIEAKIFKDTNSDLKKLSKMSKIRAGVMYDDPESCWVLTVLERLKLRIDGFGSQESGAYTLIGPNQFYLMVWGKSAPFAEGKNALESERKIDTLSCGLNRYKSKWNDNFDGDLQNNKIHANIFRGCVLEYEYDRDVLADKQSEWFNKFSSDKSWFKTNSSKKVSKIIGAHGVSNRIYLHWLIELFKEYVTSTNSDGVNLRKVSIGEKTMQRSEQHGQKFALPYIV